jgi:hypothetical protein
LDLAAAILAIHVDRVSAPEPKTPPERGFRVVGGTGLEPVTPSLSRRGVRSRPFASVRMLRKSRERRVSSP